jgi:hypothetical protein
MLWSVCEVPLVQFHLGHGMAYPSPMLFSSARADLQLVPIIGSSM